MRDVHHQVNVQQISDDAARIALFWQHNSLVLGISVFGVRIDMIIFKALLSLLGTILPILLTRMAAQWTGEIF